MIFTNVIDKTSENTPILIEFEGKKTKRGIMPFWKKLLDILEID